jgi:allantoate deiminase
MTYSIIAKHGDQMAVGTITASVCVGGFVPHAKEQLGCVATQGYYTNRLYADWAFQAFTNKFKADKALSWVISNDEHAEFRQLILMDETGNTSGWTGDENEGYANHLCYKDLAVAGNRLKDKSVLMSMIEAYKASSAMPLAFRIIQSLAAGLKAGGDKKGAISAAVKVVGTSISPIDIRVDQAKDDVIEQLLNLYKSYHEAAFQAFINAIPTYDQPTRAVIPNQFISNKYKKENSMTPITYSGQEIMAYFDEAAKYSSTEKGVTRLYCSQEHKDFLGVMDKWMKEAGLETHLDAIGNLVGRRQGKKTSKKLIIGSHQDTVIQGGGFDGILGVLLPLYVLKKMHDHGIELDYSIELVAFGDEEGVRYPKTLLGSKALCGNVSKEDLQIVDKDGIKLEDALKFIGSNPQELDKCAHLPADVLGYFEAHIEQGPVLEGKNLPVGVVTAITGIERHSVYIQGKANHAGTTPMNMRQDALVAAANIVLKSNKLFTETESLVGVVGELNVIPNAVNVIPDNVSMTIEIRSPDPIIRHDAFVQIESYFSEIEKECDVKISSKKNYEMDGAECDAGLQTQLTNAIDKTGVEPFSLFSGAGHDGLAMKALTPICMLFLRCKDGLSHHCDETINPEDGVIAAQVIQTFLQNFRVNTLTY